jgi:hypothetical protein
MGGTNDPSNLVDLTIEEHAEAHKLLFEKHGLVEDLIAWKCLSGRSITEEERILLSKSGFQKFISVPENSTQWKNNIRSARKNQVITEDHKKNISDGLFRAYKEGRKTYVRPSTEKLQENYIRNRTKMEESRKNSSDWKKSVTSIESRNKKRKNSPKSKPVTIEGVEYDSVRHAAKQSGFSYSQIRKMLSTNI